MKVYVDKMPKCCNECEWFTPNHCGNKGGRNFCLLARMPLYNTEAERATRRGQNKNGLSDFDCPLKSLAEHDKQVRKEVAEEIKKKVLEYFNVKNEEEYENSLSLLDALFTADVVFEILDKIGGEK